MNTKETYENTVGPQLKEWASKVDDLQATIDKKKEDVRSRYREQITELRRKQEEVRKRLEVLRHTGDEGWTEIKGGLDRALEDLKEGVNSAISKVRQ
jgi:hypothetical protein